MMDKIFAVQEVYVTTGEIVDSIGDVKQSLYKTREKAVEHLEDLLHSYTDYLENDLKVDLDNKTDDEVSIDFNKEEGHLYFYCKEANCYLEATISEMRCEFIDRTTKDK